MSDSPPPPANQSDLAALERRIEEMVTRKLAAANRDLLEEIRALIRTMMENARLASDDAQALTGAIREHEKRLKQIEARYADHS